MKKIIGVAVFFALCVSQSSAQDTIVYFDRPGIGDGPYITQKGRINLESGIGFSALSELKSNYVPATMLRYQMAPSNEMRLMYGYAPQSLIFLEEASAHDFTFISIGSKQRLARTPDFFADVALVGNIYYPTNRFKDISNNSIGGDAYFVFEHNFSDGSYLNYSVGYIYGGGQIKNMLQWSFAGNLMVGKFLLFGEYFGFYSFKDRRAEVGVDGGIIYEFNGNMQVDFSVIYNKYGLDKALIYAVGYSVCLNTKWK